MNHVKPRTAPRQGNIGTGNSTTTKERCGKEIVDWVQHVIRQVEIAGREMVEQVEVLHNKLEVIDERDTRASSKVHPFPANVDKIKFVPNVLLDELKTIDLGFLAIDNILPSDFHLDMVTMLPNVQVMGSITCVLSCDKDVSPSILSFLKYIVTHKDKPVSIKTDPSHLQFTFPLPHPGQYHVTAQLYGHHVHGSPLTVPVAVSSLPGLAQLGLAPLGAEHGGGGVEMKPDVDDGVMAGLVCVAKWSEDGVWYRAMVDKVEGEVVEVTFLDYGNSEVVAVGNIVKTRSQIPGGEDIDEFVEEIEEKVDFIATVGFRTGDLVIAKWNEDDIWYNAKIDQIGEERIEVTFVDYGNGDEVDIGSIVKTRSEIPTGDEIDENVIQIISPGPEKVEVKKPLFQIGEAVVAKWSEDLVWYNAKVEAVDDNEYSVLFTDYDNSATAKHDNVLKSAADIPAAETVDECVEVTDSSTDMLTAEIREGTLAPGVPVGSECIACWTEDSVWYNARVEGVGEGGEYQVIFTDYGNTGLVTRDRIVTKAEDIPADQVEMIDECVKMTTIDTQPPSPTSVSNKIQETPNPDTSKSSPWSVGDICVACWSEDGVWYNARVESEESGQYQVTFTDYGNQDEVTLDRIFATAEDIPADQRDLIDDCVKIEEVKCSQISSISNTNSDLDQRATVSTSPDLVRSSHSWSAGSVGIARWSEDGVWYNAVVDSVDQASGDIHVTFTDYGNTAIATRDSIVTTAEDIPTDQLDMIDECVKMSTTESSPISYMSDQAPSQVVQKNETEVKVVKNSLDAKTTSLSRCPHVVGDAVIACWSEDEVWYNAVIDCIDDVTGEAHVTFIDYGNSSTVSVNKLVATATDIPADELEMVDECVQLSSFLPLTSAPLASIKEEDVASSLGSPEAAPACKLATRQAWKVGDVCIACWAEDRVWYNGEILEMGLAGCLVRFSDYGNEDTVREDEMVRNVGDIPLDGDIDECVGTEATQPQDNPVPASLQCSLCSNLCRRAMRLSCGPAIACWGCAVKEINTTRTCWQCGEKEISTETHLLQDAVLRAFVEQFVSTGKLDPVHLQAIKNGTLEPTSPKKTLDAEVLPTNPIVKSSPSIKTEGKVSPCKNMRAGDVCIARWSEDDVWYNAVVEEIQEDGSALVTFSDYGNSDQVKRAFILNNPADLPQGAEVDPHVNILSPKTGEASTVQGPLDFLVRSTPGPDGVPHLLVATQKMIIKDLKGPVGLTVLQDKTVAVVCKGDNTVRKFSSKGKFLGLVTGKREFVKPADILVLISGEFVVRDELGIQLFGEQGTFIRNLGVSFINRCYGLAEDEAGRVITINSNTGVGGCGKLTEPGETDVFYIDTESGAVVKRVELIDIVGEEKFKSACRFLAYAKEKLYIVDMGLDCVYVLFLKDGEEQASAFGCSGNKVGQLRDPAGVVVDEAGTMMVVDSKNNRLQLFNKDCTFCGLVQVSTPLSRPSGIFLDHQQRQLYISNYADQTVVSYSI